MPPTLFVRIFVMGGVAIFACGYALYRHYFVPKPSMFEPVPNSDLIWAPDLVPVPASS
jgi:hypothetical protein